MSALPVQHALLHYALQALNRMRALLGTRHESRFMPPCISGIQEFVDRCDHFEANTIVASSFMQELQAHFRDCRPEGGLPDEEVGDCAFCIVECLANIFREDHLRQPTRQLPEPQAGLMRFFEDCGEWSKGDGNQASDYYYFIIPSAFKTE